MTLVAECSNGREAVQAFRTHRPDVTLMDLQMPEMSGIDAISAIRGEFPDARIIVLTTHAGDFPSLSRSQSRGSGLLAEGHDAARTTGDDPRCACRAKAPVR